MNLEKASSSVIFVDREHPGIPSLVAFDQQDEFIENVGSFGSLYIMS